MSHQDLALFDINELNQSKGANKSKAEAWLNVTIDTPDGEKTITVGGIALEVSKRVQRSIMNAAKNDPDREFVLRGKVNFTMSDEEFNQDILL